VHGVGSTLHTGAHVHKLTEWLAASHSWLMFERGVHDLLGCMTKDPTTRAAAAALLLLTSDHV
jgi:hypothetical protein